MSVKITTDGQYILADIPYANGQGPIDARLIPGGKPVYEQKEDGSKGKFKWWRYPLTMDTCRVMRRVFGDDLLVHETLSKWARIKIEVDNSLDDIRNGDAVVRLERVEKEAPALAKAIYSRKYQRDGAGWLAFAGCGLLGDEPGLGKTLQTIAALIESDVHTVLVTCPRSATVAVWRNEIRRWAPKIKVFVAQGSHEHREEVIQNFLNYPANPRRKVLVVNTEMIRARRIEICPKYNDINYCRDYFKQSEDDHKHKWVSEFDWPSIHRATWDAVVMDESHNTLASMYNIQSKHITQARYGAMLLRKRIVPGGMAIALSGTPARSKLPKFWGTLNWCRPDVFPSFWNFAKTYFEVVEGKHGMAIGGGAKNPEPADPEGFRAAMRPYFLQRTKAVAAPDLPPIFYAGDAPQGNPEGIVGIWVDIDERQLRAYKEIQELARARIYDGEVTATGILAEITRLRQFATSYGKMVDTPAKGNRYREPVFRPSLPSAKLDWILEFLMEREEYDGKIVIASCFTSIVNLFAERIEKEFGPTFSITGGTSDSRRAEVVERFNDPADPTRVCLLNSRAGGEAITLDKCCDEMVIVDPLWLSDHEDQLVSRVHRVSRIHQVSVYRLMVPGTVDQWMAENLEEQRAVLLSARPDDRREALLKELLDG